MTPATHLKKDALLDTIANGRELLPREDTVSPNHDSSDRPGVTKVDVSVVIPAYNGTLTIVDCLHSVERATHGRRREIIVVDSSPDGTADIVMKQFPDVKLIRS